MSARRDRSALQGEAPRTSRTDQSFIAGVGLAGAAAATVVLGVIIGLGAASFQIWPDAPELPNGAAVELQAPTEVDISDLPSTALLASTSSLGLTGVATGAPAPKGGGDSPSPKAPGGGADGKLAPGQGPGAPGATPPAAEGGGNATGAGEDVQPGGGNGQGNSPANPGNSGGKDGNGHGHGNGSGGGNGKGQGAKAPKAGSADAGTTTTGGRKGARPGAVKHGKV